MFKFTLKILTIILFISFAYGQSNKKWQVIKEDSEKIIYLDTKNVSEVEDQLSVWSMFVYKVMSKTDENGRRIGKEKTQYVINKSTKKYSVTGKLIYDEIGRIIRNNAGTIGPGNQIKSEAKSILDNDDVKLIFIKTQQFLSTGSLNADVEEIVQNMDNEESESDPVEEKTDGKEEMKQTEEVKPAAPVRNTRLIPKKTNDNKIVFRKNKVSDSEENEIPAARPVTNDSPVAAAVPTSSNSTDTYNADNEKSVRGVIFTDGNVFVVQKSAWRERSKAEKAVSRLKSKGQKAFITEAHIPAKGGTWYRVRVGYFNSVSEAEQYIRTHR